MKKLIFLFILTFSCYQLLSQKVEKLISQGKLEKANEYCEKQEGKKRTECFMTVGKYYLSSGDYETAENYFNKSGEIEEGYVLMAKSYMKGEIIDSVLTFNVPLAESYLKKVYEDDNIIYSEMAECLEEYAFESKKRTGLIKSMDDMGISSISQRGKTVNIKQAYIIAKLKTELYFKEAIVYYERKDQIKKVEELTKEIELLTKESQIEK